MDLKNREDKIKAKRMKTSWRDFLKEIASRWTVNMYKNNGTISNFPETDRCGNVINTKEYLQKYADKMYEDADPTEDFFQEFQKFFMNHTKPAASQF